MRFELFERGECVVAAVSGGADSICMLHALDVLKNEFAGDIIVAHLNHGLRGPAADADAEFTKCKALEMGLDYRIGRIGVDVKMPDGAVATEAALRSARYEFLNRVALETNAARIATAHTLDDQAETVLMRFLKGATVTGLAGIRPVNGNIVRPLLYVARNEVEAYCADNKLEFRTDETNWDEKYLRNRIRHRLIPALEKEYNPQLRGTLAKMAANFRRDCEYLDGAAEKIYSDAVLKKTEGEIELDTGKLRRLHSAVLSRVILIALYDLSDAVGGGRLESVHVDEICEMIGRSDAGISATLPGGITVTKRYRELVFSMSGGKPPPIKGEFVIPLKDGRCMIPEAGLNLDICTLPFSVEMMSNGDRMTEYFDAERIGGRDLAIRFPREGDRFRPLGMDHAKKLSDFFVDEKVDRNRRGQVPLLVCGGDIMWIIGRRIDQRFRLEPGRTKAVLKVSVTANRELH